jgi:hypothetical protein
LPGTSASSTTVSRRFCFEPVKTRLARSGVYQCSQTQTSLGLEPLKPLYLLPRRTSSGRARKKHATNGDRDISKYSQLSGFQDCSCLMARWPFALCMMQTCKARSLSMTVWATCILLAKPDESFPGCAALPSHQRQTTYFFRKLPTRWFVNHVLAPSPILRPKADPSHFSSAPLLLFMRSGRFQDRRHRGNRDRCCPPWKGCASTQWQAQEQGDAG